MIVFAVELFKHVCRMLFDNYFTRLNSMFLEIQKHLFVWNAQKKRHPELMKSNGGEKKNKQNLSVALFFYR